MKEMDKLNTPNSSIRIIVNQISRAASSVGANYRAACRAKSKRDFINKLKYVEEESDEVIYWLEMLKAVHPKVYTGDLDKLHDQAEQILKMTVKSITTTRSSMKVVNQQQ
jgi:four helix bundle protein